MKLVGSCSLPVNVAVRRLLSVKLDVVVCWQLFVVCCLKLEVATG